MCWRSIVIVVYTLHVLSFSRLYVFVGFSLLQSVYMNECVRGEGVSECACEQWTSHIVANPNAALCVPPSACPPFHPASLLLQSMQLSLYRCMWRRCPVYYHTSQIWGMEKTHCRYNVDRIHVRPSPERTPPPTLYMITYKPRVVDERHTFSRFETRLYIITQMLKHLHLPMLYH